MMTPGEAIAMVEQMKFKLKSGEDGADRQNEMDERSAVLKKDCTRNTCRLCG